MFKRKVKIVILFLLIMATIVGGFILYKRLEANRLSYNANIYDYLSSSAVEVININKDYIVNDVFILYPAIEQLVAVLEGKYNLPLVISFYEGNKSLLLTKITDQEFEDIQESIKKNVSINFEPEIRQYKDVDILFYPLTDSEFIVCSFNKGILAVSTSLKLIEDFIDIDPLNTFYSEIEDKLLKEKIEKILLSNTVQLFKKYKDNLVVFEYKLENKSVVLDGFSSKFKSMLVHDSFDSDFSLYPYSINIPDSLCVDSCYISDGNETSNLKIYLNKRF